MSSRNLLSKEWCNLIFEGRNKDYGAYQIRQDMGRRYAVALGIIVVSIFVLTLLSLGLRHFIIQKMNREMNEWVKHMPEIKKLTGIDLEPETKTIAGGQIRHRLKPVKQGTTSMPEIVEVTKNDIQFGVEKDFNEIETEESWGAEEVAETFDELDSLHQAKNEQLALVEPPLQPTEVVEQMPQFPGGFKALMEWLDNNIVYPQRCVKLKIGGELQISFLVDINGKVLDPQIVHSLHPDLDRSVMNAIRRMPRWQPGQVDGKLSIVRVTLPVHFQPR